MNVHLMQFVVEELHGVSNFGSGRRCIYIFRISMLEYSINIFKYPHILLTIATSDYACLSHFLRGFPMQINSTFFQNLGNYSSIRITTCQSFGIFHMLENYTSQINLHIALYGTKKHHFHIINFSIIVPLWRKHISEKVMKHTIILRNFFARYKKLGKGRMSLSGIEFLLSNPTNAKEILCFVISLLTRRVGSETSNNYYTFTRST
ncbi:unnamed protein product [Vicia faba]|uniref:Uncharacterized protein n=1 Tax=Vicia faba TaxID=3906 RepID=A0AAV0YSE0_VICFA|nr:unnamed protein product [Vicia faba]